MTVRIQKVVICNFKSYYGEVVVDINDSFVWWKSHRFFTVALSGRMGLAKAPSWTQSVGSSDSDRNRSAVKTSTNSRTTEPEARDKWKRTATHDHSS